MKFLNRIGYGNISLIALMCGAAMYPQTSFAQTGTETEPNRYDEIVVTAQRRAQNLQDVPVTITTFGAKEIKEARIQQIDDLVSRTPGLNFDTFPTSQARLFVRGIGSSDRGAAGDPSSAVFLDDIYLGRPAMVAFDAFDVERIEVLKGPQGTLYGRNVVGGGINVISKKPNLDELGGSVALTYGNFNQLEGSGVINAPLGDQKSAVRISASYRTRDGYTDNLTLNEDIDDQETLSGRMQFLTEPSDTMRIHLTLDGTRDRASGPANHVLELDSSNPLSNFYTPNFDPDISYGSEAGFQNRDTYGLRGEIAKDFEFGTLTFLTSYRDLEYDVFYDFDGGINDPNSAGFNGVNISGGNEESSQLSSQELRLSSPSDSNLDWVVGLYHYAQDVERADIFNLDAVAVAPIPLTEIYNQKASLDSYAIFGDISVPVSEKISVFGGLRYSKDDKTYNVRNDDSMAPLRGDEFFNVNVSDDFDDVTYRAGAQYQYAENTLLYATISKGFKSGGFQDTPANAVEAATPFNAETAIQYEFGQKSTFLDGAVVWNNSIFYMDYTDLQTVQATNGVVTTSNAGKATIKGYETQLNVNVMDPFKLSLAYAYTDGRFDEFVEAGVDLSGNRMSRAPKHKLTLSPSYFQPLSDQLDLSLAADYRYTSKIFDDNNNLPPELRDPTHFLDARIGLENPDAGWRFSLWGKNLTDDRTRVFQALFLGANFVAFNPPRTYGATLSWDY